MKHPLLLFALCLLISLQAFAQDTIVTMTTTNDSVKIQVEWIGSGSITANGVELENYIGIANVIAATADGSVVLVAMGDAQLTHLHCYQNDLSNLELTNCGKLTKMWCDENFLTTLDLTNCPKLTDLSCSKNPLSALNITKCAELINLDCSYTSLIDLDITNCPKLKFISVFYQISTLPVARIDDDKLSIKNPVTLAGAEVRFENISHGGIYTGDSIVWERTRESGEVTFDFTAELPEGIEGDPLSGTAIQPWTKTKLSEKMQTWLQAPIVTMTTRSDSIKICVKWTGTGRLMANGVELINADTIENIIYPSIDGLIVVTATGEAQLTHLDCHNNSLSVLELNNCPMLTHLYCNSNFVSVLDVTKCPVLTEINCSYNYSLTTLDVANCPELTMLNCLENNLTVLDVTNCTKLMELSCGRNSISVLDVSNCPKLTSLRCFANPLMDLDVTNCTKLTNLWCNYNSLSALNITKCPELTHLGCGGNTMTTLDISKCLKLEELSCDNNALSALDITNCQNLKYLDCSENNLSALTLTNCPKLELLNCSHNPLMALDVTNCPMLTHLYCVYNSLSYLDVSNCQVLTELHCQSNSLSDLDITKCPNLEHLNAGNQILVLPMETPNDTKLSVKNSIIYTGTKISIDNISHGGQYKDGNIIWDVQGKSGKVTFDFTTELPDGINGYPFSGTVTQPWTKK